MANFVVKTLDKIQTDIGLVNTNYQWTLSGNGTNEYYLEASGGGNPNLSKPYKILENDIYMAEGTAGVLAAGEWAYGDNDSLGFSTIYVRLSDDADPNSKTTDYIVATYAYDYIEFTNQTMILQIFISNDGTEASTVTIELTDNSNIILATLYAVELNPGDIVSDIVKIVIPNGCKVFVGSSQQSVSIYLAGVEV